MKFLRSFGFSVCLSFIAIITVFLVYGLNGAMIALVLAAIELAFSIDNAVINARILNRLSTLWQKIFLSVGIIIAVFGMRAILPLAVVGITAHLPLIEVADLALHQPQRYAEILELAHPAITAFGGAFLLMLSLHFFMTKREVRWLGPIERVLGWYVRWWLPLLVVAIVVLILVALPFNHHPQTTLTAGLSGVLVYTLLSGGTALIGRQLKHSVSGMHTGWAAFAMFLYLELLDATLSFDGVLGAFAITNDVVLIAVGLGIGAVWVRSLTVHLVRYGTLATQRYLEHGAHYAIAVLAIAMLLGTLGDVPNLLVGLISLGFIVAALYASRLDRRRSLLHQ